MGLLAALALVWAGEPSRPPRENAGKLYKQGRKAEKAGDIVTAYLLYSRAAALDPNNPKYWSHSLALRREATLQAKTLPTNTMAPDPAMAPAGTATAEPAPPEPASAEPAGPPLLDETIPAKELEEAKHLLAPPELSGQPGRRAVDLRGDPRSLFEQVSRLFGLDVIFDGDYPPSQPPIRLRLESADYREALRALELLTNSFISPLSGKLMIVAKDTPQKRQDLEQNMAALIPIPEPMNTQEVEEAARSVQQIFEIRRFAIDQGRRLVMMRDRVSKVRPAQMLFFQLLRYRSQVTIEVDFLDVAEDSTLNYGLRRQTSFPLVSFGAFLKDVLGIRAFPAGIPAGFTRFLGFGGGATFFGIGITNAELFASMTDSKSRSVLRSEIRSLDHQAASFNIGDKYPITTAQFSSGSFGIPQFQFEDLGLILKITPFVHGQDEISLDVEVEFKVLGAGAVNGVPIISARKFKSTVRMRNGEWAVMAGLVTRQQSRTLSGLAGIANLPVLGPLTSETTRRRQTGESLLIIKPTIVNLPPSEVPTKAVWVGTESRGLSPL